MKKIILECDKTITKYDNKLPVYFQGWLMEHISPEIADNWHNDGLKPYSLSVVEEHKKISFEINLFTNDAINVVEELLLGDDMSEIKLESSFQKVFRILSKDTQELSKKELSDIFYRSESNNQFTIKFLSPTSFKTNGEYHMFPDIRLLLQSIMRKYNFVYENSSEIDEDLFNELVSKTKIVSYRTFSSYHPIHKTYIPGFKGDIKIRCKGNQTIVNYLAMLMEFSNFSGVGIKNTMGMGAIQTKEVKKGGKYE